ncbi:hypothetical protein GCM10010168_33140 [Actinoplanes ianthinogenes]|uniref:hypothetical protein n=1 Tax=Actinoplanes ianthinogenes TaxID=122358 RepID=UPI0016708950|nr:hypothetical protein [Actinoplanes ianthinogenes]GGR12756.1 hypothetical protein GCM10010168_33140 [Actinoplanes ianthinogenes]
MRLTGLPLIILVATAASVTVAVTVRGWRHLSVRITGLLLVEILVVLGIGLFVNRSQRFYPTWQSLTGETEVAEVATPAAGRLDTRLTAAAPVPWTPPEAAAWHLATPPLLLAPPDYAQLPERTYPVVVVLGGDAGARSAGTRSPEAPKAVPGNAAAARSSGKPTVLPGRAAEARSPGALKVLPGGAAGTRSSGPPTAAPSGGPRPSGAPAVTPGSDAGPQPAGVLTVFLTPTRQTTAKSLGTLRAALARDARSADNLAIVAGPRWHALAAAWPGRPAVATGIDQAVRGLPAPLTAPQRLPS